MISPESCWSASSPRRVLRPELDGEFRGDRVADADEAQEFASVRGHGPEDLIDEIVRHRALVAGELIEELIGIAAALSDDTASRRPAGQPSVVVVQHPDLVGGEGRAAQQ